PIEHVGIQYDMAVSMQILKGRPRRLGHDGAAVPRADRPVPVAAAPDGAPSGDRRRNDARLPPARPRPLAASHRTTRELGRPSGPVTLGSDPCYRETRLEVGFPQSVGAGQGGGEGEGGGAHPPAPPRVVRAPGGGPWPGPCPSKAGGRKRRAPPAPRGSVRRGARGSAGVVSGPPPPPGRSGARAGALAPALKPHLHSYQFSPTPVATSSGTDSSNAPSISSVTSARVSSTWSRGTSKTSSSWTWSSMRAGELRAASSRWMSIIASLMMSAAVPCTGALVAARSPNWRTL